MTAFHQVQKTAIHSLGAIAGAFIFLSLPASLSGVQTAAQAQESRSGVFVGNRGIGSRFGTLGSADLLRSDRRRSIDARNARIARDRLARRGVIVGSGSSDFGRNLRFFPRSRNSVTTSGSVSGAGVNGSFNNQRSQQRISSRDLLNSDRRRSIEARNDQIALEAALRRAERANAGAGGVVLSSGRQGVINSDFGGGVAGSVVAQRNPCPRAHNCGYRLYSNGTGPRIITPGVSAGGDLPAFDGLSGPQVITLD